MILLKNRDRNPSFKKGEYVEINDAGNYPMELSVDGVCEQETTTGKQLFNYASTDYLENTNTTLTGTGEDFTIASKDNGVRAYCLGQIDFDTLYRYMSTDYVISSLMLYIADESTYANFHDYSGKRIAININWSNNTQDLSSYQGKYLWLQLRGASSGMPYTKVNYKDFILSKTEVTSYEPYTGGQPSPNPDYPQEIKTIENSLKITSCNKNLFDINSLNFENVWIRPTGEKVAANNNGFLSYVEILPNAEYILSLNKSVSSIGICEYDKNKNFIQRIVVSNSSSKTIITSPTTKYIGVFINIDGTNLVTKDIIDECEPQLEKSNQATPYEPYQGSSLNITIPSNEFVGKINDTYKDTLEVEYNKEDGHYHLVLNKMIGKIVLNGSENWNLFFSTNGIFINTTLITSINSSDTINCLSNYYINTYSRAYIRSHLDSVNNVCATNGWEIIIANKSITSIDDFKTWLSTHNTEVYYPLATPYKVDLGIVDTLLSYDEITNVFSDSDLYPVINVKYYKDFEFDKILRSGYNIDEQEYEIAKKQMANGKRKRILSSYDDCIIKINLGLLDNKTYQEYKEQLDDGEFHYWSYKYNQYKKANFILTKPSITTEYAYDDDIGIDDMEITLEKSSDVS